MYLKESQQQQKLPPFLGQNFPSSRQQYYSRCRFLRLRKRLAPTTINT